jgi:SAM-dependent methyltransferase
MRSATHAPAPTRAPRFSRPAFWCIRLMHDNFLIHLLRNPNRILESMGVKPGMKVLEVGCGPGFFTIPAAEMIGPSGRLVALDVNPYAVEHVRKRLEDHSIDNAEVLAANVTNAGLDDQSIDLAIFIGVPHVVGGLAPVATELKRILRPTGRIAFHTGRLSVARLAARLSPVGFDLVNARGRIGFFSVSPIADPGSPSTAQSDAFDPHSIG